MSKEFGSESSKESVFDIIHNVVTIFTANNEADKTFWYGVATPTRVAREYPTRLIKLAGPGKSVDLFWNVIRSGPIE